MSNTPLAEDRQTILASIRSLLARNELTLAAALLADHTLALLEQGHRELIEPLLAHFPQEFTDESTDLRYVTGLVLANAGQFDEARNLLERARFSFMVTQAYTKTASAALAIVQLLFRQDNIVTAQHYLQEMIRPLIESERVTDLRLQGRFYRYLSEISPDAGELAHSVEYARRSFLAYQTAQDVPGQFLALSRQASALVHLGEYTEAEARLEGAFACYQVGNLGPAAYMRILNTTIHLRWYQAQWPAAIQRAEEYLALADQEPRSNFRVYARVLLGNLYRGAGNYQAAETWYAAARPITGQINYERYDPWIDVQTAWLRILQKRTDEARLLLHESLRAADLGEAMSFQVGLAVISLIEGQVRTAERLLRESLTYYLHSGDELSVCALRFYLTLVALRNGQAEAALAEIEQSLGWMAQRRVDCFPHWWHPGLVSEVCAYALAVDLYPEVAERMFVHHLGEAGVTALRRLLKSEQTEAHRQARRVLAMVESQRNDALKGFADSASRRILANLLQSGQLRREGFARLQKALMTAQARQQPNATALAVFALYVTGCSRAEIALRVDCTLANVRNYITFFYRQFGLEEQHFCSRKERWQRLVQLARESEFIV